jgi:hypothetical protein
VQSGNSSVADLYTPVFAESSARPPARTAQIRREQTFGRDANTGRAEIFALPPMFFALPALHTAVRPNGKPQPWTVNGELRTVNSYLITFTFR